MVASPMPFIHLARAFPEVLNDFYEFRFEPVSVPPSNLVDDLRKLINNPAFADAPGLRRCPCPSEP